MTDLEELERLLAAATPGPWEAGRMDTESYSADYGPWKAVYAEDPRGGVHKPTGELLPYQVARGDGDECRANATLIAALRNAAPALIAEVRRLREDVGRWERIAERDHGAPIQTVHMLRDDNARLRAALEGARRAHAVEDIICETALCPENLLEDHCTCGACTCDCGAAEHNARIDDALRSKP